MRADILSAGAKSVTMYSDSLTAIRTALEWGPKWRDDGWMRGQFKQDTPANLDLVQVLVERVELACADRELPLHLVYVKGHDKARTWQAHGNARADKLASAAAAAAFAAFTAKCATRSVATG